MPIPSWVQDYALFLLDVDGCDRRVGIREPSAFTATTETRPAGKHVSLSLSRRGRLPAQAPQEELKRGRCRRPFRVSKAGM